MWFLIALALIFVSSVMVIMIPIKSEKEAKRLEDGDLSADDFEIID